MSGYVYMCTYIHNIWSKTIIVLVCTFCVSDTKEVHTQPYIIENDHIHVMI